MPGMNTVKTLAKLSSKVGAFGLGARALMGAGIGAITGGIGAGASGGNYGQGIFTGALVGGGIGAALGPKSLMSMSKMSLGKGASFTRSNVDKAFRYGRLGQLGLSGLGGGIFGGMMMSGRRNNPQPMPQARGFNGARGNRISSGGY